MDIFHYVYAILLHSQYRLVFGANLRYDLPRIPFADNFWDFAKAGDQLIELHLNYDKCLEYPLEFVENIREHVSFEIKGKMALTKDKLCLKYNDYLTLQGIPSEAYKYCIGNRSALVWIVDQYQLKEDARSSITNNPNSPEDPKHIVKLIGKIVTVSIETVDIVNNLPPLDTN